MEIKKAIENAIQELDDMVFHPSLKKQLSIETIVAARLALTAQQARYNPTPLSLDQLRGMEGKPVWVCQEDGKYGKWYLVGDTMLDSMDTFIQLSKYENGDFIAYPTGPKEEK